MATTQPTAHYIDAVEADRAEVDVALLTARLMAGLVMLPHGAQHLFGAFNGPGLAGTVQFLGPVGYLVAIGEFFGAIGLIAGVFSRFSAAAIIVIMIGAVLMVHAPFGFFMNWSGTQKGEGFEYHLVMIALLLTTLVAGPGRFSASRIFHAPKVVE